MSVLRVKIDDEVLKRALQLARGRTNIEKAFPKYRDWLTGKNTPTLKQLELLSRAASIPFGYLLLGKVPRQEKLPIPYFRTTPGIIKEVSTELIDTIRIMKNRQEWMREILRELGEGPLPFVNSVSPEQDPIEIAMEIKNTLGIKQDWASNFSTWTKALNDLENRIEEIGILLSISGIVGNNTRRKLKVEEFRGFVLIDNYAPLIFVNANDSKAAQMFTLAHELAHIWIGKSAVFDLRELRPSNDYLERKCNQIAAEFLVPYEKLKEIWPKAIRSQNPFQFIARYFKVSELVAARRAYDIDLITKEFFLDFYYRYLKHEKIKLNESGGDFYKLQKKHLGKRFARTVVSLVKEGKILYREAYKLTGLYGDTFEKFAKFILEE